MVRSNEPEALAGQRVGGDDPKGASRPANSMPPSTNPEGRAAHDIGLQFRDCPYIRGEDKWAWEKGWIEAEVEQRQRIASLP